MPVPWLFFAVHGKNAGVSDTSRFDIPYRRPTIEYLAEDGPEFSLPSFSPQIVAQTGAQRL
jgi:hypothetical protein